jgi:hypothetical protein
VALVPGCKRSSFGMVASFLPRSELGDGLGAGGKSRSLRISRQLGAMPFARSDRAWFIGKNGGGRIGAGLALSNKKSWPPLCEAELDMLLCDHRGGESWGKRREDPRASGPLSRSGCCLALPLRFTTWAMFVYLGIAARRIRRLVWGGIYLSLLVTWLQLTGPNSASTGRQNLAALIAVAIWIGGIVHDSSFAGALTGPSWQPKPPGRRRDETKTFSSWGLHSV